jgi:hypothetical protein
MRRAPTTPVKKPYQPPKFITYGNLTQMTRTRLKGIGRFDNAMHTKKT